MSGRRRARERQTAVAGNGDKMTTEDRLDVVLAVCRTPQFRLGVLGGVALLFGWTWRRKNGRRRKQEEEAEKEKRERASEPAAGASGGGDKSSGSGSGFAADWGAGENPVTAIVKHPTASVGGGEGGGEAGKPRAGILASRVDLISSLQFATVLDPIGRKPASRDKEEGDGAVAGLGASFAPAPFSPQKEVVKEVTEAGGLLSPGGDGRVEHGVDAGLPYVEDDREEAQDGDRICSVCSDSVAVRQLQDQSEGREVVAGGGASEQRNSYAVTSGKEGNSVSADDLHGTEDGESAVSFSENVGDAVVEEDAAKSDYGELSTVKVVESVPLIEAGDVKVVFPEKNDVGAEQDPSSGAAAAVQSDLRVTDALTRDGSRDLEFSEYATGAHVVEPGIEDNGEGRGNGGEDDVDGGETEKEAASDGKDENGVDEHAGGAREGRKDTGDGGKDFVEYRSGDNQSRREINEGRRELAEYEQKAEDVVIVEEPKCQQAQEPAVENGVIDVDAVAQGVDATSPANTAIDLDASFDDESDLTDNVSSFQSQEAGDDKVAALDSVAVDSFGTSDEGESDIRDKYVSSEGVTDSAATDLPTASEDEDEGAQAPVVRPAENNAVNGLVTQTSLDRYDEYLADPKLPLALRSQVMRAKAALQKFYDLKGTVSRSSSNS